MRVCPFCASAVSEADESCPACLGTLPRGPAPGGPVPRKKLDLSDQPTEAQGKALPTVEAPEPTCAIHARARAKGSCVRCGSHACEVCLLHLGVCAACRRTAAPALIAQYARDVAAWTALSGLGLLGFAVWQELDPTVLDSTIVRSSLAAVLGLAQVTLAVGLARTRSVGFALWGSVLSGLAVLVPATGGEPQAMVLVHVGLSLASGLRAWSLKVQTDELYLPLDRTS